MVPKVKCYVNPFLLLPPKSLEVYLLELDVLKPQVFDVLSSHMGDIRTVDDFKTVHTEGVHQCMYGMCVQVEPLRFEAEAYAVYGAWVKEYVQGYAERMKSPAKMENLCWCWDNYQWFEAWMHKAFHYLTRQPIWFNNWESLSTISRRAFDEFCTGMLKTCFVELTTLVNAARLSFERPSWYESFRDLCVVMERIGEFNEEWRSSTHTFYKEQGPTHMEDVVSYCAYVDKVIAFELVDSYSLRPVVLDTLNEVLITRQMDWLMQGFAVMLEQDQRDSMKVLYGVCGKQSCWVGIMSDVYEGHLTAQMKHLLAQEDKVGALMGKLKTEYDLLVCFDNHASFLKAKSRVFTNALEGLAEPLSLRADLWLRTSDKFTEDELTANFQLLTELFQHMVDKDLFRESYRCHMAKRLLTKRSSFDLEKQMLLKLKLMAGYTFTAQLESMVHDMENQMNHPVDFMSATVLSGCWPALPQVEFTLPGAVQLSMHTFEEVYKGVNPGRKLRWNHTVGDAEVRGTWGHKRYDFQVMPLQAALLVSMPSTFTTESIAASMSLDVNVAKRVLHSLSCGKIKVLLKTPENNTIKSDDDFLVNPKFSSKTIRMRIPMASLDGIAPSNVKVEVDRSHAIDACLVRIMKARKVMKHQDLVSDVLVQLLYFKPDTKTIKKRIESLLEREYLERTDVGTYTVCILPFFFYC